MNLPLVFDIATGIIFIYLILSLLTSEIQEILATLLQWRAEHLKKSVEILLTNNISDDPYSYRFADDLYSSSTIQSLNQEAKGPIARFFRTVSHRVGDAYRTVSGNRNVFGRERSGPSYIPSDAFSTALLQKLNIETVSYRVSELTLQKFIDDKMEQLQDIIDDLRNSVGNDCLLESELVALKQSLAIIQDDLVNNRTTLASSIDSVTAQFVQFIDNTETVLAEDNHCKEIIRQRLPYLKQAFQLRKLQPTISEVMSIILEEHQNVPGYLAGVVTSIGRPNSPLPAQLKRNLMTLSKQAQMKTEGLENGVRQLQQEVEAWFDHSMERASGVYRRNSKGVAILIGFLVAAVTNADTFHIVNRLSKDTLLRSTISQAANDAVFQARGARYGYGNYPQQYPFNAAPSQGFSTDEPTDLPPEPSPDLPPEFQQQETPTEFQEQRLPPGFQRVPQQVQLQANQDFQTPDLLPEFQETPSEFQEMPSEFQDVPSEFQPGNYDFQPEPLQRDLEEVKFAVNNVLEGIPLPIGWNRVNLEQQQQQEQGWAIPYSRRALGWLITGIALSMGASFWFDLLSKVVRVRNAGRTARSDSHQQE
ncbi:hypothetical protein H6G89_23700 [Oscillatoria sp. FACHB-1407]|uniref:hypothetical protein n=1 Tax=Oscillatoria sp. FACHB-1407 TaxID=2692847 RepID=UPI00168689A6|nr:hypothetical protein [Oscillatoria sp. FACHB-1407]MBD2464011.1 hypothetical protein [Oscillatoria sp. FACHB-1407]